MKGCFAQKKIVTIKSNRCMNIYFYNPVLYLWYSDTAEQPMPLPQELNKNHLTSPECAEN